MNALRTHCKTTNGDGLIMACRTDELSLNAFWRDELLRLAKALDDGAIVVQDGSINDVDRAMSLSWKDANAT